LVKILILTKKKEEVKKEPIKTDERKNTLVEKIWDTIKRLIIVKE
jgi:hypothetical protein